MTVRSDVDDLINWAQKNDPKLTCFMVSCRPSTLRKFCKKQRGGPFTYRGCEIVPVRPEKAPPPVQMEIRT